jgi:hypothetical protein
MMRQFIYIASLMTGIGLSIVAQGQVMPAMSFSPTWSNLSQPETYQTEGGRWSLPGLAPDKDLAQIASRPMLIPAVNTSSLLGDSFWMGSVTTQSYNQGKVGRYYYWDVQGNLRGSLLFVDIAGKHKRGLKLVFPRHRVIRHP